LPQPNFILFVLHSAFDPLIGFCNAIVYGWNKQLRQALKNRCCDVQSVSTDTTEYKTLHSTDSPTYYGSGAGKNHKTDHTGSGNGSAHGTLNQSSPDLEQEQPDY